MGDKDAGNDFCVWLKEGADDVQARFKTTGNVRDAGGLRLTQNFEVVKCKLGQSFCLLITFGLQVFYVFYYSKDGRKKDAHFNFGSSDPRPKGLRYRKVAQRVPYSLFTKYLCCSIASFGAG